VSATSLSTTAVPAAGWLPEGFRVAFDPAVRSGGDGTLLIGGAPIRLLRLTPAGRALLDRLAAGEPVPRSEAAQRLARRLLDAGLAHPRPPAPATPWGVDLVIPVHDDAPGLAATLAALAKDQPSDADGRSAAPASITVVDDASTEPVRSPVGTTLLRRAVQGGPGAARNDGWRAGSATLVAFVDANCEPEQRWLDVLVPHFADPRVGAVAPRILPPGTGAGVLAAYEAVASPLDLGTREATVRPHSPVPYVPTAALVVRREALTALGGFDAAMTVGEDVDFAWRLVAAGWTVRYEPRAVVRHPIRPSAGAWVRQRYRYGTSAAPLARRHGPAVAPAVMSPWTAGTWAFIAGGQPLLAAGAAGASVAALVRRLPSAGAARMSRQDAIRLACSGHLLGGLALARAVGRAWAPAALITAVAVPRARPALAAAVAAPLLVDWVQRRPGLDPVRFAALRLADDLAYGAGVWAGCGRERSLRALLPDLRSAARRPVRQTYGPVSTAIGGPP
jgi:mycofactocin system glycosyltransferase